MIVTRIGNGMYRVEHDGCSDVVYVTGADDNRWVFWNGRVFRAEAERSPHVRSRVLRAHVAQSLSAPMPATIIKVLVQPGASVKKGDTVVAVEAMKMELPIRAPSDGVVTAINCREGDLVQPEQTLVEIE